MRRWVRACFGLALTLALAWGLAAPGRAAETHVAVAANFTGAAKEIAAAFHAATGDEAVLSFGSSGLLATQIRQGAPFDVFLSADAARPTTLAADGLGVAGSVFTYAVGRLVLWSAQPGLVRGEATLRGAAFDRLSICNPAAAPYGAAAVATMRALGVEGALTPKLVVGANITQAYQFVATGNAALGFVALSQVTDATRGSRWVVPQRLYPAIRQDAVLLTSGAGNKAARGFVRFLRGDRARAIIARYGYAPGEARGGDAE